MKMADENMIHKENENRPEKSDIENAAQSDSRMLPPTPAPRGLRKALCSAAMHGEWEIAKAIIRNHPSAKTEKLPPLNVTALHVAANCGRSEFVVGLVKLLTPQELEIKDQIGRTALHHVAVAANVRAAKAMVRKNPRLPKIGDMNSLVPLLYAAQWRHPSKAKEMLDYLQQVTKEKALFEPFDPPTSDSASNLFVTITGSGSYGIALRILDEYPNLAYSKNDERMSILHVLAMQPSAFQIENRLSLWNLLTYQWMRRRSEIKRKHLDVVKLVEFVCGELEKKSITDVQDFFIPKDDTAILHLATEHGVFELVQICLKYFPHLIWYANNEGRLMLHVAIKYRRVDIFNYIINLMGDNVKAFAELKDEDDNNSLHLAANLAPSPQLQSVPGPAFQMQREVQWFKAVEALVYYESWTGKNKQGRTPRELFIEEHKDLLKDAKEWMKDTSNSSMVVAALVATIAFAAMITVPGGTDANGIPVFSSKKLFIAFYVSNALSMMCSAISLLMLLSVQTSRYTEEDFLDSLPKILLSGLTSLFIAVATMMISFGTAIGLSLQQRIFNWAYIPITIVACCPVIIFCKLQLPLILQMLVFKSGPGSFQGRRDWKFWNLNKKGYRPLANDVP